jgi:hypothetical protein
MPLLPTPAPPAFRQVPGRKCGPAEDLRRYGDQGVFGRSPVYTGVRYKNVGGNGGDERVKRGDGAWWPPPSRSSRLSDLRPLMRVAIQYRPRLLASPRRVSEVARLGSLGATGCRAPTSRGRSETRGRGRCSACCRCVSNRESEAVFRKHGGKKPDYCCRFVRRGGANCPYSLG